ncbi:MAG: peptide deformylase [Phycisphaerae bacterium]|nr:peptide deformylase [Phycisphaerae bacterium]
MEIDPAQLRIELYPADILRKRADEVDVTPNVRAVGQRMLDLMAGADGIGLAAPQVGLPWRMFVAHVPPDEERSAATDPPSANDAPEVYINPVFDAFEGTPEPLSEGCLSLPGVTGDVQRPPIVTMSWTTTDNQRVSRRAGGLLARCWQHEMDHLDGVLIIDKMSDGSLRKARSALRNLSRQAGLR